MSLRNARSWLNVENRQKDDRIQIRNTAVY